MKEIVESLLKHHKENPSDYIKKFEEQVTEQNVQQEEAILEKV